MAVTAFRGDERPQVRATGGLEGTRLGVANAHAGVSANTLTDDQLLDGVSANAAVNGVPVEVRPS